MNEPLYDFICEYREPATSELLYGEINSIRVYARNPLVGLPASLDELEDELRLLMVAGRLACEDDLWRPVPRKVERRVEQKELFA